MNLNVENNKYVTSQVKWPLRLAMFGLKSNYICSETKKHTRKTNDLILCVTDLIKNGNVMSPRFPVFPELPVTRLRFHVIETNATINYI